MFSAPPVEWIEECRQAWLDRQELASVASTETKPQARKTERACFYTEGELAQLLAGGLRQPAGGALRKPAPPEGVSFF